MQSSRANYQELKSYFNENKRQNYIENSKWLKKIQLQDNEFYSKYLRFHEKYNFYTEFRKTLSKKEANQMLRSLGYTSASWFNWIMEVSSLGLSYLYATLQQLKLISSIPEVSRKVSPKMEPNFADSFIYDKENETYYKLGKTLGRGSFGTGPNKVKVAENILTNEKVAVKILRGTSADLEIEILKRCKQYKGDFLVPSKKYKLVNQYILEELVPGVELQKVDVSKLSDNEVQSIVVQCLDQIKAYHDLGIILNDIKGDNVLYDQKTGRINFIDFGISYLLSKDETSYQYDDGNEIKRSKTTPTEISDFKNTDIRICCSMLKNIFSSHLENNPALKTLLNPTFCNNEAIEGIRSTLRI